MYLGAKIASEIQIIVSSHCLGELFYSKLNINNLSDMPPWEENVKKKKKEIGKKREGKGGKGREEEWGRKEGSTDGTSQG